MGKNEKFIYCNIGYMKNYDGITGNDSAPRGGGTYTTNNIGYEVNNFTEVNGTYYGYVQPPGREGNGLAISEHFNCKKDDAFADDVFVVWVADRHIVGFYSNARVYAKCQKLKGKTRKGREYPYYYFSSKNAILVPEEERTIKVPPCFTRSVWYGDDDFDRTVMKEYSRLINACLAKQMADIESLESAKTPNNTRLSGADHLAIVKTRINQGVFRSLLLEKYKRRCCLCGINVDELLIASHIKPWHASNSNEKVDLNNGLLLCPMHDKLFDKGYISFKEDGAICISNRLPSVLLGELNLEPKMKIDVCKTMKRYLKYHREHIFRQSR